MKWIDSHCHFHLMPNYPEDFETVYQAATDAGVSAFLNVAVKLTDHAIFLKFPEKSNCFFSAGLHPNEDPGELLDVVELSRQLQNPRIIAVGETGLDHYRSEPDTDVTWQSQRFIQHIALANQFKKPLIIHMRMASEQTLAILKQESADSVGGVMHCFTENWEIAKKALDLGFYISFSGIVSFKKAIELHEVARKIPADRYLIETDCPYLAPEPFRGKTNQPAYVPYVGKAMAVLRGVSQQQIAEESTANFSNLFGLPVID